MIPGVRVEGGRVIKKTVMVGTWVGTIISGVGDGGKNGVPTERINSG